MFQLERVNKAWELKCFCDVGRVKITEFLAVAAYSLFVREVYECVEGTELKREPAGSYLT